MSIGNKRFALQGLSLRDLISFSWAIEAFRSTLEYSLVQTSSFFFSIVYSTGIISEDVSLRLFACSRSLPQVG